MAKKPTPPRSGLTRKQLSRAKREARAQRWIWIGVIIVAAAVGGLLIFATVQEVIVAPNRVVAVVGNEKITVTEFRERTRFEYYRAYYPLIGDQPPEAFGISREMIGLSIINIMVDESVVEQKAAELGVTVSEAEVDELVRSPFSDSEQTPTPTPTDKPSTATPTATATYFYTPTPSPSPTLAPGTTPTLTPTTTPTPSEPYTATPTSTPLPTPEPQTLTEFVQEASQVTGISEGRIMEIMRSEAQSNLLRDKLIEHLNIGADQAKTMVHVAHIRVDTELEAEALLEGLEMGAAFEQLAADNSTDTTTAYKGGDMGWLDRDEVSTKFGADSAAIEAIFDAPVGGVSEPLETTQGWELFKVYERSDVPTTPGEQKLQQEGELRELIKEWRVELDVVIEDMWRNYMPRLP